MLARPNGTESPITARMRSGRQSAVFQATGAPQSCPAITAVASVERVEQADDVADEMQLRVLVDRLGRIGLAVAALVGRDDVVARIAERVELVSPRVPALGEAVTQHDDRSVGRPRLGDVHSDPVGVDEAVRDIGHRAMVGDGLLSSS